MSSTPLLARDLWAGHGGPDVLQGVSLEVGRGDAPQGVVGPSGVGKTTLVETLLGGIRPSQGTVVWHGKAVSRLRGRDRKAFRAAVRHVSQEGVAGLEPRTPVEKVVKAGLDVARKGGRPSGYTVEDLLEVVALPASFAQRMHGTLSGGEKQRVAVARAIATRPDVLILDEPFTALDPATRGDVARRVRDVVEPLGTGLLLVSHDLELVERMTATVHVLAEGRFVASGPLQQVLADAEHPVVKDLAEAAPLAVQRFR